MGFFNKYPYTNEHELNLDWIIAKINALKDRVKAVEDAIHDIVVVTPNDGKLTIKRNNTIVGDFTANQATNENINIVVPEKTSDLNNNSGFITSSDIPAQVQSNWNEADNTSPAYIQNKPTIPAAQVQSDWTQADNTKVDFIKNKPTIPTVNDATLTIQKNGTTIDTFTANAANNKTINITVPDTSDYVLKTGDTMTGGLNITDGGLEVTGRAVSGGDDEGIVIHRHSNNYAGLCLGIPNGLRSVFYLLPNDNAIWRYNNGVTSYDLVHPKKGGTIATVPTVTTSGDWTYYQDDNGYYHMFLKRNNYSYNFDGSIGSLKYGTNPDHWTFPITVNTVYYASITAVCKTDIVGATLYDVSSTQIRNWFWSAQGGTKTLSVFIHLIVK